ncbi:MAG: glycosyltransferase family 4 protein [Candidatus Acidiferrales bacterium]
MGILRIAHVCGFAWEPKGTVRFRAFPLAAALVAAGHEVTMFLPPYDNPTHSGRKFQREGVFVENVRVGRAPGLRHAAACNALLRKIIRYAPDVVHVFKPKGYAGAVLTYFLSRGWRHVVLDCDDWEGWGGWNDVKHYPRFVKEFIDLQEKFLIRHAPVVTVASRVLQSRAIELRGSADEVLYLPNSGASSEGRAIRSHVLAANKSDISRSFQLPSGPLLLYSGHFESGDDGMFFSRAAAHAARKTGATILIVGDGPELGRVKDFFSSQPEVRVRFFDRLPYERFLSLIAIADVAAYPYPDDAIHRAKCSARIIDYMAMGCAVVTTAIGQNSEYIEHGQRGILVPAGEPEQFTSALVKVLQDSKLRSFLGENAKRHVEESLWSGAASLEVCLAAYRAAGTRGRSLDMSAPRDTA